MKLRVSFEARYKINLNPTRCVFKLDFLESDGFGEKILFFPSFYMKFHLLVGRTTSYGTPCTVDEEETLIRSRMNSDVD